MILIDTTCLRTISGTFAEAPFHNKVLCITETFSGLMFEIDSKSSQWHFSLESALVVGNLSILVIY